MRYLITRIDRGFSLYSHTKQTRDTLQPAYWRDTTEHSSWLPNPDQRLQSKY
ncbi:hypothetical protein CANARDRAFT_27891 [[Candida] arabinofermentans NRRL YB-2248]|uniref:Uncharacterized protein n=1 Tax=[Candida] arabinofermentans NRRL YB-2248 TaxID=983967 RepID=A0A1E4T248_9ASCO|nr:hypothetical protein CANARDRAFT_27891 [[Candida] arabinofermentans NRRL YB-2248]